MTDSISRRSWLTMATLALASCAPRERTGRLRLALVADLGGLGDHSYNDNAWAGMMQARAQLGAHISVLQAGSYQPSLIVYATHDYDEIFCVGYDEAHDLAEVAARFPDQHFAIIDAVVDEPNVTSVIFRSYEAAFLAGALAAMVTRTRTIGFLGGIDVPIIREFESGYVAGAHEIAPSVEVLVKYVGDFEDVPTGAELSSLMIAQSADVIFPAAGKAGLGTIEQVRERSGVYAIGVDADQDALVPGKILTSVLKRIDVSVLRIARLAAAHKARPHVLSLGLKEDGVGLTEFRYTRDVVTAPMIATLARLRAAIVSGAIVVPQTREAVATFRRVPIGTLR